MSWLLNTMTNEIGENFMYYDTSKEIWDAMKKTYSNRDLDEVHGRVLGTKPLPKL